MTAPPDRRETAAGSVAAVSDRGHRHRRNEDAYAVDVLGARGILVVCDGVSHSANPDQAAAAAAAAAVAVLGPLLRGDGGGDAGGDDPSVGGGEGGHPDGRRAPEVADEAVVAALEEAVAAARRAVGGVPESEPGGYPEAPSTTLVAAVVEPGRVAVVSVGDSRAYWLAPADEDGRQLTVDDSLAEMAIADGVPPAEAYSLPQAHVITRWLGGDRAADGTAEVRVAYPAQGGVLLVCTDGLWNYFEPPVRLASLVAASTDPNPLGVARTLVDAALDAGGADNITVAVAAVPALDAAGRPPG